MIRPSRSWRCALMRISHSIVNAPENEPNGDVRRALVVAEFPCISPAEAVHVPLLLPQLAMLLSVKSSHDCGGAVTVMYATLVSPSDAQALDAVRLTL